MTPTMRRDRQSGVTNVHGKGTKQKTDKKVPLQRGSIEPKTALGVGASGTEDDFYDPKSCTSSSSSSSSSPPAPPMAAATGEGRTMTVKGIAEGLQAIELTSGGETSKRGGYSTPPFADASSSPLGSAIEQGGNEEAEGEAEFAEFIKAPIAAASIRSPQGLVSSPSNLVVGKSREEVLKLLQEHAGAPQPWTDEKDNLSKLVAKYRSESERLLFIRPEELQPIREAINQFDEVAIRSDVRQE